MSNDPDVQFFQQHPDRQAHIRLPMRTLETDKQRATRYVDECAGEFWSLGEHRKDRRRILLWKVPSTNPAYDPDKRPVLKIPFLLFADETVEDRDDILLPIIHELMGDAAKKYGISHG
jgi:hypothetical protein